MSLLRSEILIIANLCLEVSRVQSSHRKESCSYNKCVHTLRNQLSSSERWQAFTALSVTAGAEGTWKFTPASLASHDCTWEKSPDSAATSEHSVLTGPWALAFQTGFSISPVLQVIPENVDDLRREWKCLNLTVRTRAAYGKTSTRFTLTGLYGFFKRIRKPKDSVTLKCARLLFSASLFQTCLCVSDISLCTLHFSSVSFCHYMRFAEIIIGIFAFCTVTGVLALDNRKALKCYSWVSWMLRWVSHQHLLCAFAVELSSLAITSNLTKRSKGFLGLFTSSVEIVFSCG